MELFFLFHRRKSRCFDSTNNYMVIFFLKTLKVIFLTTHTVTLKVFPDSSNWRKKILSAVLINVSCLSLSLYLSIYLKLNWTEVFLSKTRVMDQKAEQWADICYKTKRTLQILGSFSALWIIAALSLCPNMTLVLCTWLDMTFTRVHLSPLALHSVATVCWFLI